MKDPGTDKQKAAFLRSEGWKSSVGSKGNRTSSLSMLFDPVNRVFVLIPEAYRIAKRRKAQREARALRKANYWVCNEGGYHQGGMVSPCLSRAEAAQGSGHTMTRGTGDMDGRKSPTNENHRLAMKIVNKLFSMAGLSAERRQALNDEADEFVLSVLPAVSTPEPSPVSPFAWWVADLTERDDPAFYRGKAPAGPAQGVEAVRPLLEKLRRSHTEIEDTWYSCPKSPEGCSDENAGTECTCGADRHNAILDQALALLPIPRAAGEKEEG